ncbi:MAG: glycosyltransferase [Candidatus Hodarchaeales archaeon]
MPLNKRIAMFLYNVFPWDPRVRKEAILLSKQGHKVTIFAIAEDKSEKKVEKFHDIMIYRVICARGGREARINIKILMMFWIRCITLITKQKFVFDAIHCHDLPTLPAGVFMKIIRSVNLIYDSHEFFPDAAFDKLGFVYGITCLALERALIRFTDRVIGVSIPQSIIMKHRYSLSNFLIIRNSPMLNRPYSKYVKPKEIQLDTHKVNIVSAGSLNKGRGHFTFLSSIMKLKSQRHDFHVYFLGDGPLQNRMKQVIRETGISNVVTLLGDISAENYYQILSEFDIGISLYEDSFNNRYGQPNTLYDYMLGGLAIIFPQYPGNYEVLREIGAVFVKPAKEESITEALNMLLNNKSEILKRKRISREKFEEKFNWESLSKELLYLYRDLE